MYAQGRLKQVQIDHCPPDESSDPQLPIECSVKTDETADVHVESSLGYLLFCRKGCAPANIIIEPLHDKNYEMSYVRSKDSDQPRHPPSLIRVFAVRTKNARVLSYLLSAQ